MTGREMPAMWVQTKTDPVTLVNLDHVSLVFRSRKEVLATIADKDVPLAECDSAEEANEILLQLAGYMHTNVPLVDLGTS